MSHPTSDLILQLLPKQVKDESVEYIRILHPFTALERRRPRHRRHKLWRALFITLTLFKRYHFFSGWKLSRFPSNRTVLYFSSATNFRGGESGMPEVESWRDWRNANISLFFFLLNSSLSTERLELDKTVDQVPPERERERDEIRYQEYALPRQVSSWKK